MKFLHALTRPGRNAPAMAITPILAAVGLMGLSPAAQAATPTAVGPSAHAAVGLRESFTVPAGTGLYTITTHGVSVTVEKGATANPCNIGAQTLLSDTTVQGVAYISCSVEMYYIAVEAILDYGSTEESYKIATEYNTFFIQVMTTAPLEAGTWYTYGYADTVATSTSTTYTPYGPANSSGYWDY